MSALAVKAALEAAVKAVAPTMPTAWPNVAFDPPAGPYQRVDVLFAEPINDEISSAYIEQGFMQVTLVYPQNRGAGDALAQAELLRAAFFRGRSLPPVNGVTTTIERTPEIGPPLESDRYAVPVRIRFFAQVNA